MKILFLSLVMLLAVPGVINDKYQEFYQSINEGYQQYAIVYELENSNYKLSIAQGVCDNELSYALFFVNDVANSFSLTIQIDKESYSFSADNRGDYLGYKIENHSNMSVAITSNNSIHHNYYLKYYDDFEQFQMDYNESLLIGQNLGLQTTKLSQPAKISFLQILLIVFISTTIIASVIILLLFIFKKGLFNPRNHLKPIKRSQDYRFQQTINVEGTEVIKQHPVKEVDTQEKRIYERHSKFADEIDENKAPIILQEKGFNIDYSNISEMDKNEIMIELMKLRNEGQITSEEYRHEVIKLWS